MEQIFIHLKSILIFAGVLSVLIIVHEWGHFITAKRLGVRVERFSVGFGPKLYSRIIHNTEFMVCLIPLGGYVKMAGDDRSECKGKPDEFFSKSPGERALIVLNGPVVNFILAYISLVFVFVLGYPDLSSKIGKAMEGYPAYEAGLQTGDRVIRVNDKGVENWTELQRDISQSEGSQIALTFLRGGKETTAIVFPRVERLKNIFGQVKETRVVGIRPTEEIITLKYGFGTSLIKAYQKLAEITTLTYKSLYFMLTGSMSAKESMTGPIGIFYIVKSAAEMGFTHLLFIMGIISASLAIFNLLPVIPLDGGHLFFLGIEKLRGQPLPLKVDEYIARAGFGLIILLALFVFYNDFERFGWIAKINQIFFK